MAVRLTEEMFAKKPEGRDIVWLLSFIVLDEFHAKRRVIAIPEENVAILEDGQKTRLFGAINHRALLHSEKLMRYLRKHFPEELL